MRHIACIKVLLLIANKEQKISLCYKKLDSAQLNKIIKIFKQTKIYTTYSLAKVFGINKYRMDKILLSYFVDNNINTFKEFKGEFFLSSIK